MDNRLAAMGVTTEIEFNTIMFEKRLTGLKDSQDSINSLCMWCLDNRQHHKKIVSCWLNVLKRVKIEQRLTLFYLANDVIQYSKRRNFEFVESWGTSLQKATTLVRDEKVKTKILRIFKIWEQRGIYPEEFLADLCGLISASPSARKGDEPHEFQSTYLIQKIRTCSKLESDTDVKLKHLKEHNPKIEIDSDSLISSLKDRATVDDVEKEVEDYTKHMEDYINALKMEIKSRINLISLLTQAESQLGNDKKDVKVVSTAYKTFAIRVKEVKKKLDEKLPTLASPVPSPDINAPSPGSDSDIDLPNNDTNMSSFSPTRTCTTNILNNSSVSLFTNAGYYNPVPPPTPDQTNTFPSNNFSSFIGSNLSFNLQNFNASSLFGSDNSHTQNPPPPPTNTTSQTQTTNSYNINDAISSLFPSMACPPPPPASNTSNPTIVPPTGNDYQYNNNSNTTHVPLLPPPMPPFSKSDDGYGGTSYADQTYNGNTNTNYVNSPYDPLQSSYQTNSSSYQPTPAPYEPPRQTYPPPASAQQQQPPSTPSFEPFNPEYAAYQNPEPPALTSYASPSVPISNSFPTNDEYNPEEDLDTWESDTTWKQQSQQSQTQQHPVLDTPESPPSFEKEGYGDPIEYHDAGTSFGGAEDVDHRVLPSLLTDPINAEDKGVNHRTKDVDHRNLISLTGSPNETTRSGWKMPQGDQDYRKPVMSEPCIGDKDYRIPPSFNIENFKLPPPPPPPNMLTHAMDGTNPFNPNQPPPNMLPNQMGEGPNSFNPRHDEAFDMPKPPMLLPLMKRPGVSPRKLQDNTESIDMDLSDDEHDPNMCGDDDMSEVQIIEDDPSPDSEVFDMLPPPLFPDLTDDADANEFLDTVNESFDFEFDNTEDMEGIINEQMPMPMNQFNENPMMGGSGGPPLLQFQMNFPNNPNSPMFDDEQDIEEDWIEQQHPQMFPPQQHQGHQPEFVFNNQEFQNRDFSFRGRGNNTRGNFNRGMPRIRGNRGNMRGNNNNNEFRGRGGRGAMHWSNRGGNTFRGNNRGGHENRGNIRGGHENRGNRGGRGMPRGGRGGWNDSNRGGGMRGGRGRGNFRGGYMN